MMILKVLEVCAVSVILVITVSAIAITIKATVDTLKSNNGGKNNENSSN